MQGDGDLVVYSSSNAERKQGFLGRIVDIGAELYAMSAACVRARMLSDDGAAQGATAMELADLFCLGARHRVDGLFHELWDNDDAYNYEAAQKVLEGRYLWAELGIVDLYGAGAMVGASETKQGVLATAGTD
jgi:ribose 5-phosphate isomerase RpiB